MFLPEVRKFITRHTAYNKHDTGWANAFLVFGRTNGTEERHTHHTAAVTDRTKFKKSTRSTLPPVQEG